jgi:hypothetical protein
MKSLTVASAIVASALLFLPGAHAQEKAGTVAAAAVETVVTVVDVDRDARVVTVIGPEGRRVAINVPPEAQNLDQVQAGARFKVDYLVSVVVSLSKGAGTGTATSSTGDSVRLSPKGGTPGGAIVHTRNINAVIEKIDRDNRMVTVRGTEGGPLDLQVDESVKDFDLIDAGDIVSLQYTEGLAMRMIRE